MSLYLKYFEHYDNKSLRDKVYRSAIYLSVRLCLLSVYLSDYLSVHPSIQLTVYLSIYLGLSGSDIQYGQY